jgi:hypothetical protein
VVYIAPEGATGLRARILAWCELAGIDPNRLEDRLLVLPAAVQLGKYVDVTEALEVVRGLDAALLMLDTRARCTVGLEENSATEQGQAIDAAELIAARGCTVLALHHSARNGTAGRGSNSWDGAVWSDLRITGEFLGCVLTCFKHKDVPCGCEHHFRLVPHTVSEALMPGTEERERETLVIVSSDERPAPVDHQTGRNVLTLVRQCGTPEGLTRVQIVTFAEERGASRTRAYAAINELVKQGALINVSTVKRERFVISPTYRSAAP